MTKNYGCSFDATIGIAGPATDGQIMVVHDLLGITCLEKPPKFIKNFRRGGTIQSALLNYVRDVKAWLTRHQNIVLNSDCR